MGTIFPVTIALFAIIANFATITNAKPRIDIDIIQNGQKISQQSLQLHQAKNLEHGLSKDFKFLIADLDTDGNPIFHKWTPIKEDFAEAENNIYVNHESKTVVHLKPNGEMKGIYQSSPIQKIGSGSEMEFIVKQPDLRNDYLKLDNDNFTTNPLFSQSKILEDRVDATVEFVIVADKEFCDVFSHNYQKILEYFIVMMWDVNLRYKTLPRTKISWQLNGIVAISTPGAQPFIEGSRGPDGRVEHGRVLRAFSAWMNANLGNFPPIDIGSVVTNAQQEWGGGLAWMNGACSSPGSSVWNDGGDFGAINVMAHELGHNLGAPHDDDSVGGTYIMGGSSDEHRHYFSSLSDKTIGDFVRSSGASCLKTLSSNSPITSPDFDSPAAPTIETQCKRKHLDDPNAWITDESCKSAKCNYRPGGGTGGGWYSHWFPPLDNSPCEGNGRCFRGKCRQKGHIIKNVGSGLCLEPSDNWANTEQIIQSPCPTSGSTALRRFVLKEGTFGTFLETPYIKTSNGVTESIDKCVYTANAEGNPLLTDKCNPWHGWTWVDVGNNQFLLKHKLTGRCAKPSSRNAGANIQTFSACESGNSDYKWTKYL